LLLFETTIVAFRADFPVCRAASANGRFLRAADDWSRR
jgi:hypothetical protein